MKNGNRLLQHPLAFSRGIYPSVSGIVARGFRQHRLSFPLNNKRTFGNILFFIHRPDPNRILTHPQRKLC